MPTPEGQSGITPPEQEQLEEERKEAQKELPLPPPPRMGRRK